MDTYAVKRLALVLAVQADIEGMKAFNKNRELNGMCIGYDESQFFHKAEELRAIAAMPDDQL